MKFHFLLASAIFVATAVNAQTAKVGASTGKETKENSKAKTKTKSKAAPAAQTETAPAPIVIPTPEFINQPQYYDSDANRLISLEIATAKMNTKKKTLGLSGAKQILTMEHGSSKVRFTYSKNLSFVIKTGGDEIDLTSSMKLYRFTINSDKREMVMNAKTGLLNSKDEEKNNSISLSVKKISPGLYMIVFGVAPEAGEYGFIWTNNTNTQEYPVYAFGIDWKKSD